MIDDLHDTADIINYCLLPVLLILLVSTLISCVG